MILEKITGNITATFNNELIDVSGIEQSVQQHFENLRIRNLALRNGELVVYRESELVINPNGDILLPCLKGRYSLYLYLNQFPQTNQRYRVRTISPVAVISTSDDYLAFGLTAEHTSLAGKILAPGGSLDLQDVEGNEVNIVGGMKRELQEETGINRDQIESLVPFCLFKPKSRFALGIAYQTRLYLDKKQLEELFKEHNARLREQGEEPELSELRIVANDQNDLSPFFTQHNVIDYLPEIVALR